MKKGIFSKVFIKYPLEEAFTKIKQNGFDTTQFNFSNIGLDSLPSEITEEQIQYIKNVSEKTGVSISVISGTFNTLELDNQKKLKNINNFENVVKAANKLNVPFVSISTGSFDQEDFWRAHPNNHTEEGWVRLFDSLDQMIKIAEENDVIIVVEPEQANVVSSIDDTIKLMEHYNSENLKVLFDAANIVTINDSDKLEEKIKNAIHKLQEYIVLAHCKDCIVNNKEIKFAPIGKGNLPLNYYIEELRKIYNGPIIMHGLDEEDVDYALQVIKF